MVAASGRCPGGRPAAAWCCWAGGWRLTVHIPRLPHAALALTTSSSRPPPPPPLCPRSSCLAAAPSPVRGGVPASRGPTSGALRRIGAVPRGCWRPCRPRLVCTRAGSAGRARRRRTSSIFLRPPGPFSVHGCPLRGATGSACWGATRDALLCRRRSVWSTQARGPLRTEPWKGYTQEGRTGVVTAVQQYLRCGNGDVVAFMVVGAGARGPQETPLPVAWWSGVPLPRQ